MPLSYFCVALLPSYLFFKKLYRLEYQLFECLWSSAVGAGWASCLSGSQSAADLQQLSPRPDHSGGFLQRRGDDIHWRQLWMGINLCYSATSFLRKQLVSESCVAAVFRPITPRVSRRCIFFAVCSAASCGV